MARRDVVIGGIWYVSADGYSRFGTLGQSVDVHDGNLARFDELNVSPGSVATVEPVEKPAPKARSTK